MSPSLTPGAQGSLRWACQIGTLRHPPLFLLGDPGIPHSADLWKVNVYKGPTLGPHLPTLLKPPLPSTGFLLPMAEAAFHPSGGVWPLSPLTY